MAGTIILTGANGSAGMDAAEHLLKTYPQYTAIFTVRDASAQDQYTEKLRDVISRYPSSTASIHQLDLANLTAVHDFATEISAAIADDGTYPPLKAIVCNAFYWNLVGDSELTVDGYDMTVQVCHIAHVALVLRLLGTFAADGGRIVILSSFAHFRKKTEMSPYLPDLPADLDDLLHPPPDEDKEGRGFQRYGNSKLLATTWMYPLNKYLLQDPKLKNVTAVAINPGGILDSRCFQSNVPLSVQLMSRFLMKPFMSVITRFADPNFRSEAGVDIADLAVDRAHPGARGYFTLLEKDRSDPLTLDEDNQMRVWKESARWAGITRENTVLGSSI